LRFSNFYARIDFAIYCVFDTGVVEKWVSPTFLFVIK